MLKPFEWKDRPALIEHLFPVQKISAESYKEQMAGAGKTLTALGSNWKGRKPLTHIEKMVFWVNGFEIK